MGLDWLPLLGLVAVFAGIAWLAKRSREICVLLVENGRTKLERGKAPAALLQALGDVFSRARTAQATVKVLRASGRPRLVATGLDEGTLQRARNVLGTFPAHKLM